MASFLRVIGVTIMTAALATKIFGAEGIIKSRESIRVGDETRNYVLIRPEKLKESHSYPLIFGFHGYRGEVKAWLGDYAGFERFVAQKEFILVYPEGPTQWIAGAGGRDYPFFDAMLQRLRGEFSIDQDRIYVLGHSNGAGFACYLALARPQIIAAAALHSGIVSPNASRLLPNTHRGPLIVFWGEKDELAPARAERVQQAVKDFKQNKFEIQFIELPNWGHSWGGETHRVEEKILTFFEEHPLTPSQKKPPPAAP